MAESKDFDEVKAAQEAKQQLSDSELIERVQNYFFIDSNLSATFETFAREKCTVIDLDSPEYKLAYTDIYNEFRFLLEDKLENFIVKTLNSSVDEFYEALRRKTEEDECSSEAFFGQILLSVIDFDIFMRMMREEAAKLGTSQQHGSARK